MKPKVSSSLRVGTPFVNEMDGVTATVSNANLRKMTSASATKKSVSPAAHATAVANVGSLFTKSVRLWTKADRAGRSQYFGHPQIRKPDG